MKNLLFFNGYGGFDPKNGDYVITNYKTPSPWCNIIANPNFGTLVSQSGASHTWFGNSSLFRISPKIDDPLLEMSGEKLFLKNESNDKIWQPLAGANEVRHSFGYSSFVGVNDLDSEVKIFVFKDKPLKIVRLKLKNRLGRAVNFSATYYLQPVLGEFQEKTKADIQTYFDSKTSMVYVKNPGSFYYPKALIYIGSSENITSFTLNRTEFLGRDNHAEPSGLKNKKLSSKNTPANDPAAVIEVDFYLAKNQEKTIDFYLGVSEDGSIVAKKSAIITDEIIEKEFNAVENYWKNLPVFNIKTPNDALNIMTNHRLLYQVVSSRLWGKTGFWQPGGAWGFRDQLQDIMALIWSEPQTARNHILLAASRQFVGGDVQHWWHPPRGDGIRTTSCDAALWLVYALNYYLEITGDDSILDTKISYLNSAGIGHQPGAYFVPESTEEKASLYDHCLLAIDRTLGLIGEHGLPLMFLGDWNDSLSKIGVGKKGESVWAAQFLSKILKDFVPVCHRRSDEKKVETYESALEKLELSLEKTWDGNWYKRAFWDDGTPLGSVENKYCRIDGLVQNWSVISETGSKARAAKSMKSVEKYLINWKRSEVRLLTPSFVENTDRDPGYIVTYPPGTRENGGNYSHNAAWSALAFAILGEGDKSMGILDILNPIVRTKTKNKVDVYLGEPYVMAGDIYTEGVSRGQAGWTWYTGSASVFYKTVIENVLGIVIRKDQMTFNPCVPSDWNIFSVDYRYGQTMYHLNYRNEGLAGSRVKAILYDGKKVPKVELVDDGNKHEVKIIMG